MTPVLLIEDEQPLRLRLAQALTASNCAVTALENGREALPLLERQRFETVVTDILMPEVDGLEVMQAVRVKQPEARIVAMSGSSPTVPATLALKLGEAFGADSVLYKPFRTAELLDAVAGTDPDDEEAAADTPDQEPESEPSEVAAVSDDELS